MIQEELIKVVSAIQNPNFSVKKESEQTLALTKLKEKDKFINFLKQNKI